MNSAASFALGTTSTAKVVKAFTTAVEKVQRPAVALVFVSGTLARDVTRLAQDLTRRFPDIPFLLAVGAGVLNEHLELDGEAGASGLVWTDRTACTVALTPKHGDLSGALERALTETRAATAFLLLRPDHMEPGAFAGLGLGQRQIFGGGTASAHDIAVADGQGQLAYAPMATLLSGSPQPQIATTRACRLISPLRPVTKYSGNMLLEIDGEQALDLLSVAGGELAGQPLIFVALANAELAQSDSHRSPEVELRPIQGVDPMRRGIMLPSEIERGSHAAFAIRDRTAARYDMLAMTGEVARDSGGALARFGIYINCAGRGRGLYESANVDTRLLRGRFGELPIVGFQSTFELAPYDKRLAMHLYAGVLALFSSPS